MAREGDGSEADRRLTRHVDVLLGAQIRAIRTASRQRQEDVGAALGVSKGQWQKYENGSNRVPAARLWQFCNLMGVDIAALCQDLPWNVPGVSSQAGMAETGTAFDHETDVEALAQAARSLSPAARRLALAAISGMTDAETRGLPRRRKNARPD